MKTATTLVYIASALFVIAFFTPYMYYDVMVSIGYNGVGVILNTLRVNGIETGLSYIPTIWLVFPISAFMNKTARSRSIALLVSAGVLLVLQTLILIALFFFPLLLTKYRYVHPAYGHYIIWLGAITLLVAAIIAMNDGERSRRTQKDDRVIDHSS